MPDSLPRWVQPFLLTLKRRWRPVSIAVAVGVLAGGLLAFTLPKQYEAYATMLPEMNDASGDLLKRLASVAGFAGLNLSESEGVEAIRPDIYPNVLANRPFGFYILDQVVPTQTGKRVKIGDLLQQHSWSAKPYVPPIQTDSLPTELTKDQQALLDEVAERVRAGIDTRTGIVTITAQMPDARAAATVTKKAMAYLQRYVTDYRTDKARHDLAFLQQQFSQAKRRFEQAQLNLFRYNDAHKNMVLQAATMEKQRLEAELTIAQSVYAKLAQAFEDARLRVQQLTPVYKVLDPPSVPVRPVWPRRLLLVVGGGLLGGLLAASWYRIRDNRYGR